MELAKATVEKTMDRLHLPYSSPTYPSRMNSNDTEDYYHTTNNTEVSHISASTNNHQPTRPTVSSPRPSLPSLPSPSITMHTLYPKTMQAKEVEEEIVDNSDEVRFIEEKEEYKEEYVPTTSGLNWLY